MVGLVMTNSAQQVFEQLYQQQAKIADQASWQQAIATGFAKPTDEDWRYTKLDDFFQLDFKLSIPSVVSAQQVQALALPLDSYLLVFVNGEYQSHLSSDDLGPFTISELGIERSPAIAAEIFQLISESFTRHPQHIRLAKNTMATKPLHFLHINNGDGGMSHSYNNVSIEQGAQCVVIEQFVNLEPHQPSQFNGARLVFNIADNSKLEHYKLCLQESSYHFGHNDLHIGRDCQVSSMSFLLAGALIRHHCSAIHHGENSQLTINSLALPSGNQTYDSRSFLEHKVGHCHSKQLHKNIVQDQANAVFNGMIKVAKGALKTDGKMDNHNLLLSETCQINSKPQLEIYADDVLCGHGTTTGALNPEQIFYLQTRGINKVAAEQMITFAFAAQLSDAIKLPAVQSCVLAHISKKLAEVLS